MRFFKYFTAIFFIVLPIISYAEYGKLYGVNIHANKYNMSADNVLLKIKKTGFNSYRQEISWNSVEQEKGKYNIKGKNIIKDEIINESSKYNIEPILILSYGNDLYDGGEFPIKKESLNGYVNYARWIAERYKGKVNKYEIWNEWTLGTGMKNKKNIPDEQYYLQLVRQTSKALKLIDPNIKVIAGSFNPLSKTGRQLKYNDMQWFENLINMGILDYIDGISIHPYSFLNPDIKARAVEENFSYLEYLQREIQATSNKKREFPIYITEAGLSNFEGPGGVEQIVSSDFIVKYTAMISTLSYVKGVWWYDLIDDGDNKNEKEDNFGFYTYKLQKKVVVDNFFKLMTFLNSHQINNCHVIIQSSVVQFAQRDGSKVDDCEKIQWERFPLMQFNRVTGAFNHCNDCNKIGGINSGK